MAYYPVASILPFVVDCGGGGSSGGSDGAFESHIADYKATYGKTDAWESWMVANMDRYAATFAASSSKPDVITISFRYETAPINYSPAWADESEHMDVLTTMAEGAYPGYTFDIVYEGNMVTSYANIIAGIAGNFSYAFGKDVYLDGITFKLKNDSLYYL